MLCKNSIVRCRRRLTATSLLSTLFFTSITATAQGSLQGRLLEKASRQGLGGATISLQEVNVKTTSGSDGYYVLPKIPAGDYTLIVQYIGLPVQRYPVTVVDNQQQFKDINLPTDRQADEHMLVIGQAASLNKALNFQRSSNSIVNAVNADAIGQYPDTNTSEALQRLPGVSVENDQGEGRFVRVRGLGPNFNSVTINGSKVPSPNAGDRAVALDTVPSDLLESLEVTKTLTPDMDADSLGGTINVKSLSAFDKKSEFYRISAEAHYDEHLAQTSPKLAVTGSKLFDHHNKGNIFGIAGAVSWFSRDFGSDNIETGGSWSFYDDPKLKEFEQRNYVINRERLGASLNMDFRPDADNEYYLRTLYSAFTDSEVRQAAVYELYDYERNSDGTPATDSDGDPLVTDGLTKNSIGSIAVTRELKDRTETMKISSVVLGGENRLRTWTYSYQLGYSLSSEDTPYYIDGAAFEAEFDDAMHFRSTKMVDPVFVDKVFNYDSYELDKVETSQSLTEDTEFNLQLDIEKYLQLNILSATIKFGGKISQREKTSNEDTWKFEDFQDSGFTDQQMQLPSYTGGRIDYTLGSMGVSIDSNKIWQAITPLTRDDYFNTIDSTVADFTINEDLAAAYLMATVDIDDLRIIAGIRHEHTEFSAEGFSYASFELDGEQFESLDSVTFTDDYSHTLPSLHLRYSFSEKTQLRAAWTNAIVRPTFEQLSPAKIREDDEIEFGNPSLAPLEASSFDLGIEHFYGFASYVSAFLFYKQIDNFIYGIDLGENIDSSIATPGIISKANTFINGDSANITGLELAATKKFNQLPSPWNGLLLATNITWSDSKAQLSYFEDSQLRYRNISLPSQSNYSGNLAIGYEKSNFSTRLAANYKSSYLLEVTDPASDSGDTLVDGQLTLDFLARWNINKQARIFFQAVNLSNEPYYSYINSQKFNSQYERYGVSYRVGISFSR